MRKPGKFICEISTEKEEKNFGERRKMQNNFQVNLAFDKTADPPV